MRKIMTPALIFGALNIIAFLSISMRVYSESGNRQLSVLPFEEELIFPDIVSDISDEPTLQFKDPSIAYQILTELDIFEQATADEPHGNLFVGAFDGLKLNHNYCEEHRAYFVTHPEFLFEEKKYMCDYWHDHPVRQVVLPAIGTDMYPEVLTAALPKIKLSFIYDMKPDTSMFYSNLMMFRYRLIGKHFSCLSQASNHIPGHDAIYKKDEVGARLAEYTRTYASRPQCFGPDKFFPKTWVLEDEEQCLEFFNEFLSSKYQKLKNERGIVYFRKLSTVHEGEGVFPVTDEEETFIRETYEDGGLCGKVQNKTLIQYAIHNPLLIEGRKFDFRVFMFIASTNPLIAFYHDGYLRISLFDYDTNSKKRASFVTNTALSKKIFKFAQQNGTYQGMTARQLKERSFGFYDRLQDYLLEKGIIQDPDWKENYLKPEIKKVMVHLLRLSQDSLLKKSSLFELFGVDLMMDENMNLWFIETNAIPLVKGWTSETLKFFNTMMTDKFEIVYSLLRSRMKRVIHYVNKIIKAEDTWRVTEDGSFVLDNLEQRRNEFKSITKNAFDPMFELSQSNGFEKIIDENYEGTQRYFGLLKEECL